MTHSNSSLSQAAILLSSLPERQAAQILARLEDSDMRSVLGAAEQVGDVSSEQVDECLNKFQSDFKSLSPNDRDGSGQAEGNLESAILSQAKQQIEHALSSKPAEIERSNKSQRPFDFLLETIPVVRIHVLSDEHPRNIAVILSMLPPEVASETMNGLDPNLRISVLKRMCELDEILDDDVVELSYAIRMRLNKLLNSSVGRSAGLKSAANLLSCSDATMREALLTHVGQSDPDLANKLKRSVFGIERLEELSDLEIKTVLKNVDTSCWAPALKNADTSLTDAILSNMAESARELLSLEISETVHVEAAKEDEARRNIVNTVLTLAQDGKISVRNLARGKHVAIPKSIKFGPLGRGQSRV